MVETVVPIILAINMVHLPILIIPGSGSGSRGCWFRAGTLDDLYSCTGTNASGTSLDHAFGIFIGPYTPSRLYPHFRSNNPPHQLHVMDGGSPTGKAGGSFNKV